MRLKTIRKRLSKLVTAYWQPTTLYVVLLAAFAVLLWFRIGGLAGGYSPSELTTMHAGEGFRHILDNPVNAPYLVLVRLLVFVNHHGLIFLRLISTLFALLTLTVFFWLVRYWHGERSALIGTIILGCSAWFLHIARLGTPEVLSFMLLALIACAAWLKRTDNRFALLLGFLLATALMYVPGMIWFVLIGVVWQARAIFNLYKTHPGMMLAGTAGTLVLLSPLVWALYQSPELAKVLAGLPAHGWPQVLDCLRRLGDIPVQLLLHGPLDATRWLGRLPILDAFSIVMISLGVYVYAKHRKLLRVKLIAIVLALGAVLIALGGAVTITILVPFMFVFVAAGIGYMLDRWYRVFPRNTIAQGVGVGLIGLTVIASCWYGLRHYYVAWPNAPATKATFVIKP